MMNPDIIETYVEKVYSYAVNRTNSREEADELSQEIFFTAIRELPKLKDKEKFEPWLWGIARNVLKTFRRFMGKQRAMYSFDILENMPCDADYTDVNDDLYDQIRLKIVMLSAIYRDIIILFYYDGLSTKQISQKLGIPEGTITWRLSEARKKLKTECSNMNETALKPIKMHIDIYGSGNFGSNNIPFPSEYINDALSQNILYYCYEEPKTVEEISKMCGVPAYYIEDSLKNLTARNAVTQPSKGKHQTDFIIWSDKYGIYCEENVEKTFLPIADRIITALNALAVQAGTIDFYKAEKSETELFYLYGILAFEYLSKNYCTLPYPEIKPNYDGFAWRYNVNMESGAHHRIGIGVQRNANIDCRGSYSHSIYTFDGFVFRNMMYSDYINVCEDILKTKTTDDKNSAAGAIAAGYIQRQDDGNLFITVPAFTKEQINEFYEMVEEQFKQLMPEYSAIVSDFAKGYRKLFPKHLEEDAARMSQSFFFGLYEYFVLYGQKNGAITKQLPNSICDVMVQFK